MTCHSLFLAQDLWLPFFPVTSHRPVCNVCMYVLI